MVEGITSDTIVNLVGIGCGTVVLTVLIVSIVFRRTTGSLENVMKGPLLPIATVSAIVGALTLLALTGIVKENAISAIFGGIVGYVLGGLARRSSQS